MTEDDDASSQPPHPNAHVSADEAYERMLTERAALTAGRQARQDSLISTIIQISSAAVLAIPGFLFVSGVDVPSYCEAPLLYVGMASFFLALIGAMAEQQLAVIAYDKQISVVEQYYSMQSTDTEHKPSLNRLKFARIFCYSAFSIALISSSIGLFFA